MTLLHDLPVIDTDSHITEPADLWTSRISAKHRDLAPQIVQDPDTALPRWRVGELLTFNALQFNHAGWDGFHPSAPPSFDEADPAGWDPRRRLAKLDELGIYAQVLFPNLVGFCPFAFMDLGPEASLECVRIYNDFQAEFASADPRRFVTIMFLPFWDLEASLKEMKRCIDLGFRGINFGVRPERLGFEPLKSGFWDRLLAQAQDFELSINFHIAFGTRTADEFLERRRSSRDELQYTQNAALTFMSNGEGIAEIIMHGVCDKFPRLKFVSIESGFGYVPFLLEALDWHFSNGSAWKLYPGRLLPSEYFRRQVYATFWFEKGIGRQLDLYPDNVMFESDFPHPTSLSPGPGTFAKSPRDAISTNLADLDESLLRKVLYETAASVYHVDLPST